MLSLIVDHFKSTWAVYIIFALALFIGTQYIQNKTLEQQLSKRGAELAQCESARLIQNEAVLKMKQEAEAAKQAQIALDKEVTRLRADGYKSVGKLKNMPWADTCDEAAEQAIGLLTKGFN